MRFVKSSGAPGVGSFSPELHVVGYIATRKGDAERGPQIRMHPADAHLRMLADGEVVWIHGPRGQQVAPLVIDDRVAQHTCVLRDAVGVSLSEAVRVSKPDLDTPPRTLA